MKYSTEELETIEKSIYKAVKRSISKALGTQYKDDSAQKVSDKKGKNSLEDVLDENFVDESSHQTPPRKQSQLNKSNGVSKLKKFVNKKK